MYDSIAIVKIAKLYSKTYKYQAEHGLEGFFTGKSHISFVKKMLPDHNDQIAREKLRQLRELRPLRWNFVQN